MSYPEIDAAVEHTEFDVIATPIQRNSSGGGLATLLFYYNHDGILQPINSNLFETGTCWVIKDYEDGIEKNYAPGELFKIRITKNKLTRDETIYGSNYADWCCTSGKKAESVENNLIRVLECDLPDIDTGTLPWYGGELQRGRYFIKSKEKVYGPFEITIDFVDTVRTYVAKPYASPRLNLSNNYISSVDYVDLIDANLLLEANIGGEVHQFVKSLNEYVSKMRNRWTEMDYISASQIIRYISDLQPKGRKKLLTRSQVAELQGEIQSFLKSKGDNFNEAERFTRAIHLLNQEDRDVDTWSRLIDAHLQTEKGIQLLKQHQLDKEQAKLDDKLRENYNTLSKLDAEIREKGAQRKELEKNIQQRQEELKRTREQVEDNIRKQNKALQAEKSQLESDIQSLEASHKELEAKFSKLKTIDDLKSETDYLDRHKRTLTAALEEIKEKLSNPTKLTKNLSEVHAVMDILGYAHHSVSESPIEPVYRPAKRIKSINDTVEDALNVVSTVCHRIALLEGRELSEAETANMLICLQQNFLTILQGSPGVGKTSTAINLAKALGIFDDEESGRQGDFLNIPVSRGWTGIRDVLGYYNGLKGVFQPARTGLYEFLLNGETAKEDANLRIVLLDEANLSPLEHYLSDFIGLADKEGASRALDTGCRTGNKYLYPARYNTLRFCATINNDSTTEPLSERVISRAPIISMDEMEVGAIGSRLGGEIIDDYSGAMGAQQMERLFGRNNRISMPENSSHLYDDLQKIIGVGTRSASGLRNNLKIDGRKRMTIDHYLSVASVLMGDNVALAQDFALSQFVLPHIKGEGEGVRRALSDMLDQAKSNDLERSAIILQRIIDEGDDYLNSYSFF